MSIKNMAFQESSSHNETLKEISWEIDDIKKYPRDKKWYIIAAIIAVGLIVYALITKNYFFALIIILASGLIIYFDNEPAKRIPFSIKYNGFQLANTFFEFQTVRNFYIIYKPKEDVKKLFVEFKNPIKHRLSIDLENQDPVEIRNYLLQYLDEDLEKENEPISEGLAKIFRL